MIPEILKAVMNEAVALLQSGARGAEFTGTVILDTDFRAGKLESYAMPLLLIDVIDAPDAGQCPGGWTKVDWVFGLNSYNYQPDPMGDDQTEYSTSLQGIIDDIRQHFSDGLWLIPSRGNDTSIPMSMQDVQDNYGFVFTLSGLTRANNLEQDGLILGWRIMFDSLAFDTETDKDTDAGPLAGIDPDNYPAGWEPNV